MANARVVTHQTRAEALAAEAAAIRTDHPRYNVMHAKRVEGQSIGDALVSFTDADRERREQRAASYVLFPRHHVYDLLAKAGLRMKRWDVPQSYHSDWTYLASLDDYERQRLEFAHSMSPQRLRRLLYV